MTPEEEIELEHRLGQIEQNADADHKALVELRKEFDALKKNFTEFRESSEQSMRLLMWFTEQVRSFAIQPESNQQHAIDLDTKAREILEELKIRLRQSQ